MVAAMKPRLAFLCLGNSCRSIMAEALTRHFFGGQMEAVSAGLSPLGWVAPETLVVLAELHIPTAGLWSKGLAAVDLVACQAIINFSGRDLKGHLPPYCRSRVFHREIADPFGFDLDHYRRSRDAIRTLLERELPSWLAG